MATIRLSASRIKGVSRILKPEAQRFSPCLGLITTSSSNVLANLRCLPVNLPAAELARELFHQRTGSSSDGASLSNRRYGPVGVTKSRSRAAYWITPSMMGAMTGLAATEKDWMTDAKIDEVLFSQGIECNYVNREWSGVSMVRYRKIVRLLAEEMHSMDNKTVKYALPVALAYVWEKARSKQCLLDYVLSLENTMQQSILLPDYSDLRQSDSSLRREWVNSHFAPNEITPQAVHDAAQSWLNSSTPPAQPSNSNTGNLQSPGEALEILAASYAMERSFKAPIRLGRYAYGDGKPRPDCVEVVVREIFDTLIYDPDSDRLCPELLPDSTAPAVKAFYSSLLNGDIDDVSTQQNVSKGAVRTSNNVSSSSKGNVKQKGKNKHAMESTDAHSTTTTLAESAASLATTNSSGNAASGAATAAGAADPSCAPGQVQYWEATTAGRAWFHLCSELPHSLYLSATSDSRLYELKPTMLNVCDTIRALLGAESVAGSSSIASGPVHSVQSAQSAEMMLPVPAQVNGTSSKYNGVPWRLKDLEHHWNQHCTALNLPHRKIVTTEGTLRFRAPFSDTEMINRETGTIQFVQGKSAIDIELESSHQLATVKHRLCVDPALRLWSAQNRELFAQYWKSLVENNVGSNDYPVVLSAVLNDSCVVTLLQTLEQRQPRTLSTSQPARSPHNVDNLIIQALLSARWGEERRQGSGTGDPDSSNTLSVTDASLTTADAKRQQQQSVHMTLSALKLIAHVQNTDLMASLVRWMLQEAPTELSIESLTATLLCLPHTVRVNKKFQAMLATVYETQHAALLQQMVLVGTEHCPSRSFFTKCDLSFSNKAALVLFCLKYKFRVLKT